MSTLVRIFQYTSRYKWRALTTFLLAVLCTLLVLVLPGVTQKFTDEVIPRRQEDRQRRAERDHPHEQSELGGGALPFSLSTRRTTTTSFLPTRMSFWMERIRRRDSSDSRIIPSMLSYSSFRGKTTA